MKKNLVFMGLLFVLLAGCTPPNKEAKIEQWKEEIINVEKAFNDMALKEGIAKAFEYYVAEDGVIMRNNTLTKGKAAIALRIKNSAGPGQTLSWAPTFVDVSASGDLAYTYGDYTFKYPDSLGNIQTSTGIFHTVWKRQADGSWKFVWD